MDLSSIHMLVKICFVLIPIGGLLDLIGFASPYWVSDVNGISDLHAGLWKICGDGKCVNYLDVPLLPGWLIWLLFAQYFETVGLILVGCATALLILTLLVQFFSDKKLFPILNGVLCFGAAGCIIVGAIIYGTQIAIIGVLGWAFYLCIVGAILLGVAGVLLIVSARVTVGS